MYINFKALSQGLTAKTPNRTSWHNDRFRGLVSGVANSGNIGTLTLSTSPVALCDLVREAAPADVLNAEDEIRQEPAQLSAELVI